MRALLISLAALALLAPATAAAAPAPLTWCGSGEVGASRQPKLQLSSPRQVHVVYAIPSDVADDFSSEASAIATDASAIDAFWRNQDPGRAPRFDLFPFPNCGSTFGNLDLGFVRLPGTSDQYAQATSLIPFIQDLGDVLADDEKTVVYFNGRFSDPDVCGLSQGNPDLGGRYGLSVLFMRSNCGLMPLGSGVSAVVAAHELTHNLGAVDRSAPHTCPDNPGHVCDSTLDLLYPFLNPGFSLDVAQLDAGRDDYYGHSGAWWDVQDSTWLSHLPQFLVTVATSGKGSVSLTGANGIQVDCNPTCNGFLDGDASLQATATPASGFTFRGWSGSCTGRAACRLSNIASAVNLTAAFQPTPRTLAVRVSGRGRVTSRPAGISCPGSCSHGFAANSVVRLTATAAKGWRLAGWSGACSGRGTCNVRADRARLASARFEKR